MSQRFFIWILKHTIVFHLNRVWKKGSDRSLCSVVWRENPSQGTESEAKLCNPTARWMPNEVSLNIQRVVIDQTSFNKTKLNRVIIAARLSAPLSLFLNQTHTKNKVWTIASSLFLLQLLDTVMLDAAAPRDHDFRRVLFVWGMDETIGESLSVRHPSITTSLLSARDYKSKAPLPVSIWHHQNDALELRCFVQILYTIFFLYI